MADIENKEKLLLEFNQITSVAQKFKFWDKKLSLKFIFYLRSIDNESTISNKYVGYGDFMIYPKEGEEILEFNTTVLEDYKLYFESLNTRKKIIDLESLKNTLTEKLKTIKDRKSFLEQEIKRVDEQVSEFSKKVPESFSEKHQHFLHAFENEYFNDIELDLSISPYYDISDFISALNGNTLGKYLKYLKSLFNEQTQTSQKKTERLTQEQQFLVLEYLGILDKLDKVKDPSNEKKGEFVGLLIDKNISNCRIMFSYLADLKYGKTSSEKKKVKANLMKVASFFEKAGLKTIVKLVEVDIKKLSQ